MKKPFIIIIVLLVIFAGWVLFKPSIRLGGDIVALRDVTNSSAIASISDPLQLIASNSAREYLRISVDNDDNALIPVVYLFFDSATESHAYGTGLRLTPGTSWEMPTGALYTGAIWGVASPSATRINYIEY